MRLPQYTAEVALYPHRGFNNLFQRMQAKDAVQPAFLSTGLLSGGIFHIPISVDCFDLCAIRCAYSSDRFCYWRCTNNC